MKIKDYNTFKTEKLEQNNEAPKINYIRAGGDQYYIDKYFKNGFTEEQIEKYTDIALVKFPNEICNLIETDIKDGVFDDSKNYINYKDIAESWIKNSGYEITSDKEYKKFLIWIIKHWVEILNQNNKL